MTCVIPPHSDGAARPAATAPTARSAAAALPAEPQDRMAFSAPTLETLPSGYDGPIFVADVNRTLCNPGYHMLPYVGVQDLLQGVAAMHVPMVYLACSDDEGKAVARLPVGTVVGLPPQPPVTTSDGGSVVDSSGNPVTSGSGDNAAAGEHVADAFRQQSLRELCRRFPSAHFVLLGNNQGNDAKLHQEVGGTSWIHNVRADQSTIPKGFGGLIRDVYSPPFVRYMLDCIQVARANSTSLGGKPGSASPPTAPGLNSPPIRQGFWDGLGDKLGGLLKKEGDLAKFLAGQLVDLLRPGVAPVDWVSEKSDGSLHKLSADALGVVADRLLMGMGLMSADQRTAAGGQLLRVLTAHGSDAGHVEGILLRTEHNQDVVKLLDGVPLQHFRSLRQEDHPAKAGDWAGFGQYLDAATGTRERPGTTVEPLIDGQIAFPRLFDAIDGAKSSVNLSMYAFQSDETGWEMARHMASAADRGCKVRLLYDVEGSSVSNGAPTDSGVYDFLRKHGVDVIARQDGRLTTERTHRKLLVIDGAVGFIGGMNVGNEYRNEWHDTHARVAGPAVADMQGLFVSQWQTEGGKVGAGEHAALFPELKEQAGGGNARIIGHDGRDDVNIKLAYLRAIDTAEHTINIADPYFADQDVLDHLKAAAGRGCTVNLVFPNQNDVQVLQDSARSHYPEMLGAGIHIFEYYGREMAHDKVASFDGKVCTIGSSNLDQESLFSNYEANIWSTDPKVAQQVDTDLFACDFPQCYSITHADASALDKIRGKILAALESEWL